VVLYSVGDPSFSTWPSNVLTKLNDLGISAAQITSLTDGEPVIILAKKGAAAGSAKVFPYISISCYIARPFVGLHCHRAILLGQNKVAFDRAG